MMDVGLTNIRLGQSNDTFRWRSQRVKLARELSNAAPGRRCIFSTSRPPVCTSPIFSNSSTCRINCAGQHQGNTIVVIEHDLDVIETADWIVDLGPEGGSGGGEILVSYAETVAECEASHTARFLEPML
ncbi:hypothetical protein ACNKHU_25880 [Shigella flexneri]